MVSDDQTLRGSPADWVAVPQPRSAGDALDKPPAYHALHPNTSVNFGLDRVTIVGVSLGGGLAIRAAAGEPRVARVIADDVLTDFLACNLRQFPTAAGTAVRALLGLRAGRFLDALLRRRMQHDLLADWAVAQGEHVLGGGPRTSTLPR